LIQVPGNVSVNNLGWRQGSYPLN